MTQPVEMLPSHEEAIDYLCDINRFNLDTYTQRLVSEAQQGSYNLRTRSAFLLSVGAIAMFYKEEYPFIYRETPFLIEAKRAIEDSHSLELIASCDDEMPYWQTAAEWRNGVRDAFKSVRFGSTRFRRPEFSSVGCTILLECLNSKKAYIKLSQS